MIKGYRPAERGFELQAARLRLLETRIAAGQVPTEEGLAEAAAVGYTSVEAGAVSREVEAAVNQQKFLASIVAANDLGLVKTVKPVLA